MAKVAPTDGFTAPLWRPGLARFLFALWLGVVEMKALHYTTRSIERVDFFIALVKRLLLNAQVNGSRLNRDHRHIPSPYR